MTKKRKDAPLPKTVAGITTPGGALIEVPAFEFGVPGLAICKDRVNGLHAKIVHLSSGETVGTAFVCTPQDAGAWATECYAGPDWTQDRSCILANPVFAAAVRRFEDVEARERFRGTWPGV